MKPIPEQVQSRPLEGLPPPQQGKVCDLYDLLDYWPGFAFKYITDRISVHDIVLPFLVFGKGIVLNYIDLFWRRKLGSGVEQDIVAIGQAIDNYLPAHLCGNPDLHRRGRIVRVHDALAAELIFRGLLTGSGLKSYRNNNGVICGQQFPADLKEWSELTPPAFTPTTKSKDGHDEHMDIKVFLEQFGEEPIKLTRPVYEMGKKFAAERGIIIADTKFEVGRDPQDNALSLIDEVLTPDSSRFLKTEDIEEAKRTGKRPPSYDKQPIRDYVSEHLGVTADTELTPKVITKVQSHRFPGELAAETATRYEQLGPMLMGISTRQFEETLPKLKHTVP